MENLTDEQNAAVSHFREFTHIDSVEICQQYLVAHEWDVERAINTALASNNDFSSQETNQRHTTNSIPPVANDSVERFNPPTNNHVAFNASQNNGYLGVIIHIFISFFLAIFLKIRQFIEALLHLLYSFARSILLGPRQVDPIVEVDEFCAYFDRQYGTQHPAFYRGRLSQALQDAQREVRSLFIYIHEKNSVQCDKFCREIFCGDTIQSIIGSNLIWSCSSDTQEGANACRLLDVHSFPCFCIVAHQGSQQTIQLKLDRYSDADEFLAETLNGVQHADEALEYNRQQRNNSSSRNRLLEEQNQAYMDSMQADLQKAEQRKREEMERLKLEEDQRQLEEEKQRKLREFAQFRDRLRLSLPTEPSADENDLVQVSIRLPSTEPIRRRFRRSDPAKLLFEFAWTDTNVPDQFELLWGYPRKRYQYEQIGETIIGDVISGKSETCFLEEIDDEK